MSLRATFIATLLFPAALVLGHAAAAQQDDAVHAQVRKSLVQLKVSGTPSTGPNASVPGGVLSQATGFFVGRDGYLLTTEHFFDPLTKVDAKNIVITGSVGGDGSVSIPVDFVSDLPRLDLVLLKADIPFDMPPPVALEIGSTANIDTENLPHFMTSGFHGDNYRKKAIDLNEAESEDLPYAWTFNEKINAGQSGSPVYIVEPGGKTVVVGVIKGHSKEDDELALMIPIEYSMPLVGHFEIQKLNERVEWLMRVVGEISESDPPLQLRVQSIEGNLLEIGSYFDWSAETLSDGSLSISYQKIVKSGAQVDQIELKLTPNIRLYNREDNNSIYTGTAAVLKLTDTGQKVFDRSTLDPEGRVGTFVIPAVQTRLKSVLENSGDAVGKPEPYRDLELLINPLIGGTKLPRVRVNVVPTYEWD